MRTDTPRDGTRKLAEPTRTRVIATRTSPSRAHLDEFPQHLMGRFAMLLEQSGLTELAAEFRPAKA